MIFHPSLSIPIISFYSIKLYSKSISNFMNKNHIETSYSKTLHSQIISLYRGDNCHENMQMLKKYSFNVAIPLYRGDNCHLTKVLEESIARLVAIPLYRGDNCHTNPKSYADTNLSCRNPLISGRQLSWKLTTKRLQKNLKSQSPYIGETIVIWKNRTHPTQLNVAIPLYRGDNCHVISSWSKTFNTICRNPLISGRQLSSQHIV